MLYTINPILRVSRAEGNIILWTAASLLCEPFGDSAADELSCAYDAVQDCQLPSAYMFDENSDDMASLWQVVIIPDWMILTTYGLRAAGSRNRVTISAKSCKKLLTVYCRCSHFILPTAHVSFLILLSMCLVPMFASSRLIPFMTHDMYVGITLNDVTGHGRHPQIRWIDPLNLLSPCFNLIANLVSMILYHRNYRLQWATDRRDLTNLTSYLRRF
jgi:hypothetical protein